jgi:Leucine-rich repeat (LRR) protein
MGGKGDQMDYKLKVILTLSLASIPGMTNAMMLPLAEKQHEPILGSAYQSDKENLTGQGCFNAPKNPEPAGVPKAGFTFASSISEETLSNELGFNIGGRMRYGIVKGGADVNFFNNSVSNQLSVSAIWQSSYSFPNQKMIVTAKDLNETGKKTMGTSKWANACGDRFVDELEKGGKLFFSVRVDFQSKDDKKEFNSKFSLEGPLGEVSTSLKSASRYFSKNVKVTVSAYQVGGDISKITKLFSQDTEGRKGFLQCQLGNFEGCATVISNALIYATDIKEGFPSQLQPDSIPGPATIGFKTTSYDSIGLSNINYPELEPLAKNARKTLSREFERQFEFSTLANRLIYQKNIGERKNLIESERVKINQNLSTLTDIADTCFIYPKKCHDSVYDFLDQKENGSQKIHKIDESVFYPEKYEYMCGLRKTNESVESSYSILALTLQTENDCNEIKTKLKSVKNLEINGDDMDEEFDLRILSEFKNLRELKINKAKISELGPISRLKNLEKIDLSYNRIKDIEPLSDLNEIQFLDLSHNRINDLESITQSSNLIHLDLSNNRIKVIPELNELVNLQELHLSSNLLTDLNGIYNLSRLLSLDLSLNGLSEKKINELKSKLGSTINIKF